MRHLPSNHLLGIPWDSQSGENIQNNLGKLKRPQPTSLNVSNEKDIGWLFDIGDCTTQLYGDYNNP